MRLHWSPKSPYVRKVMVGAHVLGLAQRMELVRSVAANDSNCRRSWIGRVHGKQGDRVAKISKIDCSI